MKVIIFESEAYYKMLAEQRQILINEIKKAKSESIDSANSSDWLTIEAAKKILPYKSKTKWQDLRDQGLIVFAQFGRKILYSKESLYNYINKNKI